MDVFSFKINLTYSLSVLFQNMDIWIPFQCLVVISQQYFTVYYFSTGEWTTVAQTPKMTAKLVIIQTCLNFIFKSSQTIWMRKMFGNTKMLIEIFEEYDQCIW